MAAIPKRDRWFLLRISGEWTSSIGQSRYCQQMMNKLFSFYYYSFIGQPDNFSIEYADEENKRRNISLRAIATNKDSVIRFFLFPPGKHYSIKFINDTIALLTIKGFIDSEQGKHDFPGFLDSAFTAIRKKAAKHLIIDLRGNPGGQDEYGSLLYSYLTATDFKYYKELLTVTDSIPFLEYTNEDSSLNQMIKGCVDKVSSYLFKFRDSCHTNLLLQKPNLNYFPGEVYVLINGALLMQLQAGEFVRIILSLH